MAGLTEIGRRKVFVVFMQKAHSSVFEGPRAPGVSWSDLENECIKGQVKGRTYPCILCIGAHDQKRSENSEGAGGGGFVWYLLVQQT